MNTCAPVHTGTSYFHKNSGDNNSGQHWIATVSYSLDNVARSGECYRAREGESCSVDTSALAGVVTGGDAAWCILPRCCWLFGFHSWTTSPTTATTLLMLLSLPLLSLPLAATTFFPSWSFLFFLFLLLLLHLIVFSLVSSLVCSFHVEVILKRTFLIR